MWTAYRARLEAHPLVTKSIVAGILLGGGDLVAQLLERWESKNKGSMPPPIDWVRTGRVGALGVLVTGPIFHYFYGALDRRIPGSSPGRVAAKVLLDQAIFSPASVAGYLAFVRLANGDSIAELRQKFWGQYKPMLMANYMVWPAAQALNFSLVPAEHRVLFVSAVAAGAIPSTIIDAIINT